jgi:hypothetical protein
MYTQVAKIKDAKFAKSVKFAKSAKLAKYT